MKKVVINRCFGGFSLSPLATKRAAELQGKECYFFDGFERENMIPMEECDSLFWSAYSVPNAKEALNKEKDWSVMSDEEKNEFNKLYDSISIDDFREDRTNPILIQVVEELGKKASGRAANLNIVEIPDDVKYTIEEYDGLEHVAEKHRTWE